MTEPKPRCDTIVSLREYVEALRRADIETKSIEKALMEARMERAEIEMERRLDSLNHLRENTISKPEYAAKHAELAAEFHTAAARLEEKVAGLLEWKAEQRGKASTASVYLAFAVAIIGVVISLVTLIHDMVR